MIENEIVKELNWKEKIIFKLFKKTFLKVYTIARIEVINIIMK